MKIIYGITKSNFGGAQRYVFELAEEAKRAGHDVSVVCGGDGILLQKLAAADIKVFSLPYLRRDISFVDEIRSFHFIFKVLVQENPDVFHSNSSKMGLIGNMAARLAGIGKIIFTAHGWAFNETRPRHEKILLKILQFITILLSHSTICVSEKTKKDVSSWPLIKNKLVVIRNGVKEFEIIERIAARSKLNTDIDPNTILIGSLSELHHTKGLDILLRALPKINSKNIKVIALGSGEEKANLEKMARNLAISEKVSFLGYMENARSLLSGFDIFVLPSRSEAMPYSLLEAGFVGVPVVASRVGGIPEVVESSQYGAVVEPENVGELSFVLNKLIEDVELRKNMGSNLKILVGKKFSFDEMIHATLKLYGSN